MRGSGSNRKLEKKVEEQPAPDVSIRSTADDQIAKTIYRRPALRGVSLREPR